MHIRASNSELVEPLPEPICTLNRRLRRRNRRVPFEQRNNPPQHPRVVYLPMDDEPKWAADRVVAPNPGYAITIPETANEFAIKDLWNVITNDDIQPIEQNPKTKLDEVIPFERREYTMAVRGLQKVLQREVVASCGDSNHLIRECPKPPKDKNQRAFVGGSWSYSGEKDDEKVNNETCLVAQASSEICLGVNLEPDKVTSLAKVYWTRFLMDMIPKAFDQFKIFSKKIQNQLGCTIVSIRTDHGREFDNEVQFGEFCNANGITHNFSAPRTPQSNGVVERKNRTLQEMSRTMLNEQSLPQKFWCNAVDTSTYILNRILIRAILGKTPYELLRGRKPTLDYFRVFGSKCFILNTKDYLTKFDPKSYEGVFLGYSQNSKAYIILNKHTRKVEESLNVTFDETPPPSKTSPLVDDDLDEEEAIKVTEKKNLENDIKDETL
ncbi:retrovirus-related pol polyprotein from transposon TNT 1-94 [Tanacetum coccineum]